MAKGKTTMATAPVPRAVISRLSPSSIAKACIAVILVLFSVLVVYLLHSILLLLFLGIFVATIIDPGVRAMGRWGVPRSLAILFHYTLFLGCATFLVLSFVPIIASQVTELAALTTRELSQFLSNPTISVSFLSADTNLRLTYLAQNTLRHLSIQQIPDALKSLGAYLSTLTPGSLQFATGIAGSVVRFIADLTIVLLFAFFFEIQQENVSAWAFQFLPKRWHGYAEQKAQLIHRKLSQWAKAQLLLCLSIAVLVFIVLVILRIPYALTLAILAGFTEFIPYVGAIFAAVPSVLIATTQFGFGWGILVAVCYYAIQWGEGNIIMPLIMKRTVDLSSVAIMFAMLVGVSFPDVINPILGILISIPLTAIIGIFLDDFRSAKRTV